MMKKIYWINSLKEATTVDDDEKAKKLGYQDQATTKNLKVYLLKKNADDASLDDYHLALVLNPKNLKLKAVLASPANTFENTTSVELRLAKSDRENNGKSAILHKGLWLAFV